MAQLVLTVAGYAIGTYFGYPQLGAAVGELLSGSGGVGRKVRGIHQSQARAAVRCSGVMFRYCNVNLTSMPGTAFTEKAGI